MAAHAGDEMVSLVEQGPDPLATGVVGVGDEEDPARDLVGDLEEELDQTIELGPPKLSRGVDHALVDPGGERNGGDAPVRGADELGQGLEGMAFDPLGLGVVGGLLMQLLDRRHPPALLGDIDAVGQADAGAPDLEGVEVALAESHPEGRERPERERFGVEEMEQA